MVVSSDLAVAPSELEKGYKTETKGDEKGMDSVQGMNLNEFAKEIHQVSVEHGWWEGEAYDDPERKEKYEALNAAIDLINNPSMLQRWISVKERLPEENKLEDGTSSDLVIVVVQDDAGNRFVSDDIRANDAWVNYPDPIFEVTHYMPLLELPEEEV